MLNYHKIIKNARITRTMTQQDLAKGICSPSYLSKIEKGSVIPTDSVRDALLKKLNININLLEMTQEEAFLTELCSAYKQTVLINSADHAQIVWNHFNEFTIQFTSINNFYQCNLYLQRIAIIANQSIAEIDEITNAFETVLPNFSAEQTFLYYMNCAHSALLNRDYEQTTNYLMKIKTIIDAHPIEPWFIGDFYLLSNSIAFVQHDNSNALSHINSALHIFEKIDLHIPMINCYIRISIIYNRNGYFNQAKQVLEKAFQLAVQTDRKELYGKITQNLGYTAALLGHSEQAIHYYENSLNYKNAIEPQLISIHSIVKEYSKQNDTKQVTAWCDKGLSLLKNFSYPNKMKNFVYHFSIYEMIHRIRPIDTSLITEAMDFFINQNELVQVQKYSHIIAKHYELNGDFQEALRFLKISSDASLKIQGRKHWQDLS